MLASKDMEFAWHQTELEKLFAARDNEAELMLMYDSSEDIEKELIYEDEDLFLGSKITMLMRTRNITNHWQSKKDWREPNLSSAIKKIVFTRAIINKLVNGEKQLHIKETFRGKLYKHDYHNVWLSTTKSIEWQLL